MFLVDFSHFAEIWRDPNVVLDTGGGLRSRGEARDSIPRNTELWHLIDFGQWGVVLQSSRNLIGQAGFFYPQEFKTSDVRAF